MLRLPVLALVLGAVTGAPLSAQVHPLVGGWDIAFSAGGPGTPYPASTPPGGSAFLHLTQQGDSLIAQLMLDPLAGQSVPVRMAAKASAGDVTFERRAPAPAAPSGQAREATTVTTWVFTVNGDVVTGTVQRRTEGLAAPQPPQTPSHFRGTRMPVVMGTPG